MEDQIESMVSDRLDEEDPVSFPSILNEYLDNLATEKDDRKELLPPSFSVMELLDLLENDLSEADKDLLIQMFDSEYCQDADNIVKTQIPSILEEEVDEVTSFMSKLDSIVDRVLLHIIIHSLPLHSLLIYS